MDNGSNDKRVELLVGPVIRVQEDKPTETVGIGVMRLPGEIVYETPDAGSSVGYSAVYSAAFNRVFRKPKPEELN